MSFTCSPEAQETWQRICRIYRNRQEIDSYPAGHDWGEWGPVGVRGSGVTDLVPQRAQTLYDLRRIVDKTEKALLMLESLSADGKVAVWLARRKLKRQWTGDIRRKHGITSEAAQERIEKVKEYLWHYVPLKGIEPAPLQLPVQALL